MEQRELLQGYSMYSTLGQIYTLSGQATDDHAPELPAGVRL